MSHKIEGICTYKCSNATSDLVRCSNHLLLERPITSPIEPKCDKGYHRFIFVHKIDNCFAYNLT